MTSRGSRLTRPLFTAGRAVLMILSLLVLRWRGIRVVWTVHNIAPHESRYPRIERFALRSVARLASALHVHSEWAGEKVRRSFGAGAGDRVLIGHHGNYVGSYALDTRPREEIRRELGLPPDGFVYLVFGVLRDYKRIPETIEAFRAVEGADARLVVAGGVSSPALRERLERLAAADDRVVLRLEFVPEEEVGSLFAAADVAVLNYAEVFSSGALLLALSFGVPVIAPEEGSAREIGGAAIEPFAAGRLPAGLGPGRPRGLRGPAGAALDRVRTLDLRERAEAARAAAAAATWDALALQLVDAYRPAAMAAG